MYKCIDIAYKNTNKAINTNQDVSYLFTLFYNYQKHGRLSINDCMIEAFSHVKDIIHLEFFKKKCVRISCLKKNLKKNVLDL